MTPERWQQIKTLFQAVLEQPAARQAAFLEQACAGDEELRRQVEAMLSADAQQDQLLDRPAYAVAAQLLTADPANLQAAITTAPLPAPLVGTKVGVYQITRELGRGGMGAVYLARDTRLERTVALKLLPAHLTNDAERVRRFQREARAASALNHPNILTIYDFGADEGRHYIATEFVAGQTLRAVLRNPDLPLLQALDVAMQVASALAAAHEAGIIHRDIKPENLMLRPDGYVKVLDFGLAKLTEAHSAADDAATAASTGSSFETRAGMVLGTVSYMSPEQARGQKVDARTDIFSLGVVLYEMIAGRRPFEGATRNHVLVAILDHEPPPLLVASAELQRIVSRALAKERAERYQTAYDLLTDLKALKEQLALEPQMERLKASGEVQASQLRGEIKRYQLRLALALAALIIAAVAGFFYFNRAPALTERDTVLLADFDNKTGEAVFDGTLKQALAVQLEQSPFLNIYSDEQMRAALRYMNRSADERVTKEVAREICQRQRLKALLSGMIVNLGSHYVITLEAVNAQTGEALARQQVEADSKEQVLSALGKATTALREKLGESLRSIQKFDTPLEQATTSSLAALKAFSLSAEKAIRGKPLEAIPFLKHAVELDPEFAMAYKELSTQYNNARQLELTAEASAKAFALRARVTEREKLHIEASYYVQTTVDYERAIAVLLLLKQTYPQDVYARNTLAYCYNLTGQFEKALEEARAAMQLNPQYSSPRSNLAAALVNLNRLAEARAVLEQMSQAQLDTPIARSGFYVIASAQGDAATAQQQLDWLKQNSHEYYASYLQAWTAAKAGRMRQSEDFGRQAVEQARQRNIKDLAASFAASEMLLKAGCGLCRQVRQEAAAALILSRIGLARSAVPPLPGVAFALALCGEVAEAQKLADELARRYPQATTVNAVFLPLIQAAIELHRGNADRAVQLLEAAAPYENAVGWWPTYLRGQAYLRLKQGAAAAAEFQKILDHPGWGPYPYSIFYAPAQLGLARAAAMSGDGVKARQAYQDFFTAWKDADADLPILLAARKEYEQVK